METHCAIASFDSDGKLTVWAPTQAPFLLQELLAEYLDLPMSKVRVVKPYCGGGYGSKMDRLVEHICALLSRMTGRPVRSVFTREEEFTATVSRHADIIRLKVGVRKDGTLSAIEADLISNEGAYMYKPGPSGLAGRGLTRTYRCPNTKYEGHRVYTNLMSGGAFRGYGNLQAHFAVETMMDIVAEKLGIDPVEFRLRNYKRQGDTNFADLPIKTSGLAEGLAEGAAKIGGETRGKPGGSPGLKSRGIGIAAVGRGAGALAGLGVDLFALGFGAAGFDDFIPGDGDGGDGEDPAPPGRGDRAPHRQMSFTVHDTQAATVEKAIDKAKKLKAFRGPNKNANGNALHRICAAYIKNGGA